MKITGGAGPLAMMAMMARSVGNDGNHGNHGNVGNDGNDGAGHQLCKEDEHEDHRRRRFFRNFSFQIKR